MAKQTEIIPADDGIAPDESPAKLALASSWDGAISDSGYFYMPNALAAAGITPEKLTVPKDYHSVIDMCYDFYQRGGIVSTVVNRLTELSVTEITNGQRKTSNEANDYFDAILHRKPSYMNRFVHNAALEYFLSGMVLPRVDWVTKTGAELSPKLKPNREYEVPVFDLYPSKLVKVEWAGWGKKEFYLRIPEKDIKAIKSKGGRIKAQQQRYANWMSNYPSIVDIITSGKDAIKLEVDPILRKEISISEYPTPFLYNILESLVFKQQLRRMDFSVASRVINAILLIQEGDEQFPITEETRGNLDELKKQIYSRTNDPRMTERLFMLFSNHTTKLTWITPDVSMMLDQEKYKQTNEEIDGGLGFAKILVTGESRNAQASEVSTWAIQPMMEELRGMLIEWMQPVYEEASEKNNFRHTPEPQFAPIRLQDFIKTAAVFAQAFKEGNISRTTRDGMMGLNFKTELELMEDEREDMEKLTKKFPEMPYNVQVIPGAGSPGGGLGRPAAAPKGGRPTGSQNVPVNNRNRGVKPKGQTPVSRVAAEVDLLNDDELINLMNTVMAERGITITADDITS